MYCRYFSTVALDGGIMMIGGCDGVRDVDTAAGNTTHNMKFLFQGFPPVNFNSHSTIQTLICEPPAVLDIPSKQLVYAGKMHDQRVYCGSCTLHGVVYVAGGYV